MEYAVVSTDEWEVRSGYTSEADTPVSDHRMEHQAIDDAVIFDQESHAVDSSQKWLHSHEPPLRCADTAFLLISFGYMLPWTSLGSLISYYKYNYSANFYVKLYCGYYLPGLPVALLQLRFDTELDKAFGSQNMYLIRGTVSFLTMICIMISMVWISDRWALFFLFILLGVCGWLCHGTASMLASMHPSSSIAYLQTGFRCPEIYTIAAVALLHIGKDPTQRNLDLFYIISAIVVSVGLFAWIYVVESDRSKHYFDHKDNKLHSAHTSETRSLFSTSQKISAKSDLKDDNEQQSLLGSEKPIKPLQHAQNQAIDEEATKKAIMKEIFPLCLALFITIFCSIFQASFFAYVDSPQNRDIEQILYFVRLFSDLLGRPLTRLPRPFFFTKKHHVLVASILRISLMIVFFAYILIPNFPRSDLWITALVAVFSVMSGYFTVLIYEFAAHSSREIPNKSSQTYATAILNISFQLAAFTAVLSSVYITNSDWFERLVG